MVMRSIIELNVRVGLLRSWPLPKPTPYLTLNAGMRTNSLLFPLGDIFRRKSKIVDQTSKDTRYRWGSSFGGAFFEDKFNHLETVKVFYRLPEPLFFNRPGISQCLALGFLSGAYFPDEDGLISYTNTLYYSMTTFHKYIINTSTIVPIRFSVSAGGGFGHSTTIKEMGPTTETIDYNGVGYLITMGGRLEIGHYYGETSWNIRDADPAKEGGAIRIEFTLEIVKDLRNINFESVSYHSFVCLLSPDEPPDDQLVEEPPYEDLTHPCVGELLEPSSSTAIFWPGGIE